MDDHLLTAFLVVMGVNVMLWLGQVAALEMNPEGPQFFSCQGSLLGEFEANGCTGNGSYVLDDENPAGNLPTGGGEIEVNDGNFFIDTFSAAVGWFTDTTGLKYLYNILAAPSNFLKAIGVPDAFAFAVGAMWYATTLLLLIAFLFGR